MEAAGRAESRVARYKLRLSRERLANKELGRRIAELRSQFSALQVQYEEEHRLRLLRDSELEQLQSRLLLLSRQGTRQGTGQDLDQEGQDENRQDKNGREEYCATPKRAVKPKLERCLSPSIHKRDARLKRIFVNEALALRKSVTEQDDNGGNLNEQEDSDIPPDVPTRTSIEFILRSSLGTAQSQALYSLPHGHTTGKNKSSHTSALACACFIAGANYDAATQCKLWTSPSHGNVYGRVDPSVLSCYGAVDMDDTSAPSSSPSSSGPLPDLVSNMCFPNGVRLEENICGGRVPRHPANKPMATTSSTVNPIKVSVFSLSVPTCSSASDLASAPPLYGIFAMIDSVSQASLVEHNKSGRVLCLPFAVCFLTRTPHFQILAEVLKEIVALERQRAQDRIETLCRGDLCANAMHVNGPCFGKLGERAAELVAHVLGFQEQLNEKRYDSSSNHPLLRKALMHGNPVDPTGTLSALSLSSMSSPRQLFSWGGPALIGAISLERTLVVLGCALTETKIVFVSNNASILGSSVLAFSTLLLPLIWSGPLVPVLPTHLLHMLDAPFPLIAGITRMTKSTLEQRENDTVIVDLDRGRIFLPTIISSAFHNYKINNLEIFCANNQHLEKALGTGYADSDDNTANVATVVAAHRTTSLELYSVIHEKVCQILSTACCCHSDTSAGACGSDPEMNEIVDPFITHVKRTQMFAHYRDTRSLGVTNKFM